MTAYGGARGTFLWDNILLPLARYVEVRDAGLLTAGESRLHDLAVETASPVAMPGLSTSHSGTLVDGVGPSAILLVGGGTGMLQWIRFGGASYALQRFGPTLVGALGVATL